MAQTSTIGSVTLPVAAPATSESRYGPVFLELATSPNIYARYAYLYTPAQLNIPTGAVITELAWLKSDATTLTGNNVFNVLLGNSTLTTLVSSSTWGTLTTGTSPVYSSTTQQVTGAEGTYFSVRLSQPFTYTGGNLLLLTDFAKQGTASSAMYFVSNSANGTAIGYGGSAAPTATTALTTSYGNQRPTLRVTYTPSNPCTAPPTAGTTLTSASAVCVGSQVNLSLQGATYGQSQTFQWQESTNGTTFIDIAGATSPTYTSAPMMAPRTFRAVLTCGSQAATSTPAAVAVNAATYASLPVLESFESTWGDACSVHDAPTNSWRSSPTFGNSSWRREDDGLSAGWSNITGGQYTPTGSLGTHSARFHSYSVAANGTFDFYVNLSAAGNKLLQFDYFNSAGNDSLQVEVSTDGGATFGAPLLRLGVSGTVAQGWQNQNVSLATTSATTVVRFRTKVTTAISSDIGLDNVRLSQLVGVPNCATSLFPAAGTTNASRATILTWQVGTGGSVTTGYDVYFGTTATPPLVSSNQTGTAYATTTTLLAPSTTYYYQIVARNANGPAVGCPVQSFTTSDLPTYCNPSTTLLGGFCGTTSTDNVTQIRQVSVGGSGLNATNLTCNSVGNNAYTSYPATGNTTGTLLRGLTYPLTVTAVGRSIISVWVDFNQNGSFEASEWTQVSTFSAPLAPNTVYITVPTTATLGLCGLRVRSRRESYANAAASACTPFDGAGYGETKDFVVTIGAAPACAPPMALAVSNVTRTSASLGYGSGPSGAATGYVVQYGTAGFDPAQPSSATNAYTTVNTTALSVQAPGLTAGTSYQFYVTKSCGGGATSQPAGPFTFSTLCVAPIYAALPLVESFETNWLDACATQDVPTPTWRNVPGTGDASWRRDDAGTTALWVATTLGVYAPTGSQGLHSARFHSSQTSQGTTGDLDLYANLSAAGAKRLSFDFFNTSGVDSLLVLLSTDGGNTFGRLAAYNLSGTVAAGFGSRLLTINSTSATAIIRFRGLADLGLSDIALDNIILESATGCLTPAALTVSATTATAAAVSWSASGPGPYTLYYGRPGFTPTLPSSTANAYTAVTGLTSTTYTISGLTASTDYQFYVVQNCAANSSSALAGPVSFATACPTPPYAALPFAESFENAWLSGCYTREMPSASWRNSPGTGNTSWRREDDGISASWTQPDQRAYTPTGSQGNHSARFHSAYVGIATGSLDLFVNLSPAGAKRLSFDFSNISGPDSLVVLLSNDGGLTFGRLATYNLGSATGFTNRVLPLSSTSATAVLRFRAQGGATANDIGLDNIIIELDNNCLTPTGLTATTTTTTAALSWPLPAGAGTYTVVYGPSGFNPLLPSSPTNGYTTATGLTVTLLNLTGLTPGTQYQFYVTQNCAAGVTSGTSLAQSFTTQITNNEPCTATMLPLNNTCTPLLTTTVGATTTAATVYDAGGQGGTCGANTTPRDVWFAFTTAATGPTSTQVRISVTGGAASVLRAYSGNPCTGLLTYVACTGTAANTAAPNLDLLALAPSTTYYLRVNDYNSTGVLGDFSICASAIPVCATPLALTTGTLTSTRAQLNWSATPVAGSTFTVFYGPSGFTPGGANSTSITGLTAQAATLNSLQPNTSYCFSVQQVCGSFNGSSTISAPVCFTTPTSLPLNDEPCGAIALGNSTVNSSNMGATTSIQNGIVTPACTSAVLPKDVWFTLVPSGSTTSLTFTGGAVGMVRVFTAANCASGPFIPVSCAASTANGAGFPAPIVLSGLVAGQRYYVAVSGNSSSDATGPFTVSATSLLASKGQANTTALVVYPNPSSTGQLTLRLSGVVGTGQAVLLNALGQVVLNQPLSGTTEQTLPTHGLATGVYTLRVSVAGQVFTRKVVLE